MRYRSKTGLAAVLMAGCLAIAQHEGPRLVEATDFDTVAANDGKTVILRGKVASAEWSRSGAVLVIQFENANKVMAAAFQKSREKLDAAFNGDYAKSLTGAKVRLTGKIQPYGGHDAKFKDGYELVIWDITQTTIIELAATQPAQAGEP